MSILNETTNLHLTQFTGDLDNVSYLYTLYNSDMQKIDAYVGSILGDISDFESTVTQSIEDLTTLVNTYDTRITTLEGCCSDVNTTLSNYGARLNEIELVIDTVSTQNIEDLIARIDALELKVEANTTQIATLQNDLREAVQRFDPIEDTLVTHASEITQLKTDVDNLEECCQSVQSTLTAYDARITQNAEDIDALEERLTRDESNITGNARDIAINSQQIATNTQDIQDLKDAFSELDPTSALEVVRQVAINTTDIANIKSVNDSQNTRLTNVENRVTTLETNATALTGRVSTLESEFEQISDWQQQIDDASAMAQQASDDVSALTTTVNGFDARITQNSTDIATNADDIDAVESGLASAVSRITTLESNETALEARVTANESDLLSIHQTITADETGLANLGTRVSALETQVGSVDVSAVGDSVTDAVVKVNTKAVNAQSMATQALAVANAIADTLHPVGSVYLTIGNTNPGSLLGFGTWSLLSDGYLRNNASNASGGSMTTDEHVLTVDEMPSHNHTQVAHNHNANSYVHANFSATGNYEPTATSWSSTNSNMDIGNMDTQAPTINNTGGGQGHAHDIEPSYTRVYAWERTA